MDSESPDQQEQLDAWLRRIKVESAAETNVPPKEETPPMTPVVEQSSWKPTKKWIATQITALAAVLTMWATTGSWDTEETVAIIGLVSQAAVSWYLPNDNTPGGVPLD